MNASVVGFGATLALIGASAMAMPQTVNVDFEAATFGETTYAGDDAALSSPGGTTWNSIIAGTAGASDLLDEFGNTTGVGVALAQTSPDTDPASTNVLEDSGLGGDIFVVGLLPGQLYSLVGYVMVNGGFAVTDANGNQGFQGFGFDFGMQSYDLPGIQGGGPTDDDGDYMRFDNLLPADLGGGLFGVQIQTDGIITGLQIRGVIPAPSTILLAGFAGLPALSRRRR